ncbi:MAG: PAS domain-containing protein [Oceanicaulis sp.]
MSEAPRISGLPEGFSQDSLHKLPVAVVITDPALDDNPIVYVNDAFETTTGYAPEDALGRNCRFLQGPNTDPLDREQLREAIDKREEIAIDILNYRKNGEEFHNRLLVTPVRAQSGDALYFLGLQHEIGAAKSYARRAAELDERLKELQHRVKNHLALIVAMIRAQASDMDRREASQMLAKRVEAISLLYSKMDLDSDGGESEVDLGAYVERVSEAMQALSQTVAVKVDVQAETVTMAVEDAARVGLLVSEILTNALKHAFDDRAEGDAAVKVSLKRSDDALKLIVEDNGGGLDGADWPDSESLGGQIVLDLVRRLKGELDVRSAESGVKVELSLPG